MTDEIYNITMDCIIKQLTDNYIDKTLTELWQSRGIYRDKPKSWNYADWPTLSDLRDVWKKDIDISKDFVVIDICNIPDDIKDAMNVFFTDIRESISEE